MCGVCFRCSTDIIFVLTALSVTAVLNTYHTSSIIINNIYEKHSQSFHFECNKVNWVVFPRIKTYFDL